MRPILAVRQRGDHMKRHPFRALGALALAALLAACGKPAPAPEAVRHVRTLVVAAGTAGGTQEYAADIRARTEARLAFRVGGKLVSRTAELGQRVNAGAVLAQLDAQDLRLGQDAARAAVNAAQVNHDLNAADYKRFKDLRDQGFISGAELDRREAAWKAAAAQLEQARAQAAVQVNQAAYANLVATAPGVVVGVDAEPGMVLAAGTPVLRVAYNGPRDAVFAVPEDAVAPLRALLGKAGAVNVTLWGSKEALPATVREVAAAADAVTRTYQVKAELAKALPQLGQTATVSVALPRTEGVSLLPLSAIKDQQGGSAVWVVDPAQGVVRSRSVQVAGTQGNEVVIKAGLNPGDRVVVAGVHVLTEGQPVKVAATAAAAPASAASGR